MSDKILVVDDEQEITDLVELYLQNENYEVFKFYSAKDAGGERLCPLPEDQGATYLSHHHADSQGRGNRQNHRPDPGSG